MIVHIRTDLLWEIFRTKTSIGSINECCTFLAGVKESNLRIFAMIWNLDSKIVLNLISIYLVKDQRSAFKPTVSHIYDVYADGKMRIEERDTNMQASIFHLRWVSSVFFEMHSLFSSWLSITKNSLKCFNSRRTVNSVKILFRFTNGCRWSNKHFPNLVLLISFILTLALAMSSIVDACRIPVSKCFFFQIKTKSFDFHKQLMELYMSLK